MKKIFLQFVLFCMVGVTNALIQMGAYNLGLWIGIHYIVSNAIAFVVSVTWSFFINKIFVFKNKDKNQVVNYFKTVVVYLVSFLVLLL